MEKPKRVDFLSGAIAKYLLLTGKGGENIAVESDDFSALRCGDHYRPRDVLYTLLELQQEGIITKLTLTRFCEGEEGKPHKVNEMEVGTGRSAREAEGLLANDQECGKDHGELGSPFWILRFSLKTERTLLVRYLGEYVQDWIEERLTPPSDGTFFKAAKQLEMVVKQIYLMLEEYPEKHLSVAAPEEGGLDFLGTILFLEHRGFVEIEDIKTVPEFEIEPIAPLVFPLFCVRITLLPAFREQFQEANQYPALYFDYAIRQDEIEKEMVVYHPLKLLRHKGEEYRLNEGIPLRIIQRAGYYGHHKVPVSEITDQGKPVTQESLEKALRNFKSAVRKKLRLNEFVDIVDVSEDHVVLNDQLFYLRPQKIKKAEKAENST